MGMNALLDIAIGLVLMYLMLSLACTSINEFITTVTDARANTLKNSLLRIIDVDTLRNTFYGHGLIDGSKADPNSHPSYVSGATFALALIDSLDPKASLPDVAAVEAKVKETLPESNVRDILLANISMAGNDLTKLRTNLALSFDRAMDRVNGTYKRKLKWISLGVGFALAAALNADSIVVATDLWKDSSLRAQMVQAAQTVYASSPTGMPKASPSASELSDIATKIQEADKALRPLPIGWDFSPAKDQKEKSLWAIAGFWALKFAGVMITAIALMLGAPFWFDTLSKFMSVRGTGQKPARTEAPSAQATAP